MSSWLPREIEAQRDALQQVLLPIAEARGLPNAAYTSESFAAVECDQVLARGWTCIGVGRWVPQPGDLRPVRLLGLPLLMLRDAAGNLKVFHNVCSHRGLELVATPGRSKGLIRCPYHSWSYDLDGNLKATPFVGGPGTRDCPGFDRMRHGLKPVRSAVWATRSSSTSPARPRISRPSSRRWRNAGRLSTAAGCATAARTPLSPSKSPATGSSRWRTTARPITCRGFTPA